MAIKTSNIYKKYIQAKHKLLVYSEEFTAKLGINGRSRKARLTYNTLTSWVQMFDEVIPKPYEANSKSPKDVVSTFIPTLSFGATNVYLYLELPSGVREYITKIFINAVDVNQSTVEPTAHPFIDSITILNNALVIKFKKGSSYNGGKIVGSSTLTLLGNTSIQGGVTYEAPEPVNIEEENKINIILDKIAVELGIVYSDKQYNDIQKSLIDSSLQGVKLLSAKNVQLTAEDGTPLEV